MFDFLNGFGGVLNVQVEAADSWRQVFLQEVVLTLTVAGQFHDRGTVEGGADIGDVMDYAIAIGNAGSVTLTNMGKSNCQHFTTVPEAPKGVVSCQWHSSMNILHWSRCVPYCAALQSRGLGRNKRKRPRLSPSFTD